MASDDSSARPAAPIVLRIKLRYDDVEVMVQRFAANVGKSGLFLPTKSMQPLGAEIKFELRLADDTPALVGLGRVKASVAPDPANPRATFGMAIELMRVTPQSRALILRMLERRRLLGLPDTQLPMAADVEAARRAEGVEGVRDLASGPVAVVVAAVAVAPAAAVPVARTPEPAPSDALLTAPRRSARPTPSAQLHPITPLSAELPRRKRVAVSELIEAASGPIAVIAPPSVDDASEVDVAAALTRARALAGSSLDAELESLAASAAVPVEISIENASAALAQQLGGSAVRRDRSARWAPPPAITAAKIAPAAAAEAAAEPEAAAAAAAAAEPAAEPAAAAAAEPAAAEAAAPEADAAPAETSPVLAVIESPDADAASVLGDPPDPDAGATAELLAAAPERPSGPFDPGQSSEEIHQLDDFDLEDVEHTEMGAVPIVDPEPPPEPPPAPDVDQMLLAARLEADLAAADDDDDNDDLGLAIEHAPEPAEPPIDLSLEEFDEFEILAESEADVDVDPDRDPSAFAVPAAAPSHPPAVLDLPELQDSADGRPSLLDFAARLDFGEDSDVDFALPGPELPAHHIIDHDDLSDAFATLAPDDDAPSHFDPGDSAGLSLSSFDDADDHDETANADAPPIEPPDPDEHHDRFARRIVQPIFEPEASSSFTLAGIPSDDFELPPISRSEYAPHVPITRTPTREPALLRGTPAPTLHPRPVEDPELEHALDALDVDLDDLSIPHAATQLQRSPGPVPSRPSPPSRAPAPRDPIPAVQTSLRTLPDDDPPPRAQPRAPSLDDDEVIIDFDED